MTEANSARYRGRVRTGCLTCRASKVRCDEQKPVCKRCIRLQKDCTYPQKKIFIPSSSTSTSRDLAANSSPTILHQHKPDHTSALLLAPRGVLTRPSKEPNDLYKSYSDVSKSPPSASTPQSQSTQSYDQSPSFELSRLISQDIYLCTTIDLLAARQGGQRRSFAYFREFVESPFISPYDPANWAIWKKDVVNLASQNVLLAGAVIAAQSLYQARMNSLPLKASLTLYKAICSDFEASIDDEKDNVDYDMTLSIAFLLSLVEMLVPQETSPGFFASSEGRFVTFLEDLCRNSTTHSPLCLRLTAWLLIAHAAARRSGGRGLLSTHAFQLFSDLFIGANHGHLPTLPSSSSISLSTLTLATLSAPLFAFHLKIQLLSARIADLSHYHRSRVTPDDQEEVSFMIKDLTLKIEQAWNSSPPEIHHQPAELRSQFSLAIAEPLILLSTLCRLTYHTDLVEAARNLSDPEFGSDETKHHLACIRDIVTNFATMLDDQSLVQRPPSAFLRALFLYAIESTFENDTAWAVSVMRTMKDTVCCSDFFANFAEGLAQEQAHKGRRVTTKWWCWQVFGISPPYL